MDARADFGQREHTASAGVVAEHACKGAARIVPADREGSRASGVIVDLTGERFGDPVEPIDGDVVSRKVGRVGVSGKAVHHKIAGARAARNRRGIRAARETVEQARISRVRICWEIMSVPEPSFFRPALPLLIHGDIPAERGRKPRSEGRELLHRAGIGNRDVIRYDTPVATMCALIKNQEGKVARNDPRWKAFGLNMLATRYRWRVLIVGLHTEYELAVTSTEPMASITHVAAGQMVQIIVQAVNGSLQGVAREPVVFTLPAGKIAGFTNRSTAEEAPAVDENTNGNGNGHSRHDRVAYGRKRKPQR